MMKKIEIDLEQVERLASRGLTLEQIAAALGISERTLHNRKRDSAGVAEAIKRGQAKGIAEIANSLYETARKGNVTAMIFFLKSRAGWREMLAVSETITTAGSDTGGMKRVYAEIAEELRQSSQDETAEMSA